MGIMEQPPNKVGIQEEVVDPQGHLERICQPPARFSDCPHTTVNTGYVFKNPCVFELFSSYLISYHLSKGRYQTPVQITGYELTLVMFSRFSYTGYVKNPCDD